MRPALRGLIDFMEYIGDDENEIWDLVDENRMPTGKTHRRGDPLPEGALRQVIHICIFNKKGQMLIQKRQPWKKAFPGMWDVSVGGSVISGEDSRTAAARETKEELGLDIDFSHIRPKFTFNYEHGFDDFYLIEQDVDISKLHLQESEVQCVAWASIYDIHNLQAKKQMVPYAYIDFLFDCRQAKNVFSLPPIRRKR